ncbi:hypothetical protein SODALDRAFT_320766 [Sodiomyces alkalinus F11]|uniref:Uncharacterized protein n=1 Tax=Sodiomyces alkalinus (strain CBS 110278 / VKM F-3762 / F11) TaxID=1314773 RepID=A0A3N2PM02_SODAK|nr:hypothetical protein SODALDRAFT_320766 [Sodiomyces alkalinus F11]ROT35440.1 hypothetical protein SODALDRAFT_320766 [Sodiomyces alkalinus F11]
MAGSSSSLLSLAPIFHYSLHEIFTMSEGAVLGYDSSDIAPRMQWARAKADSNICLDHSGNISGLVGTAFVARDLISVVDALDEDDLSSLQESLRCPSEKGEDTTSVEGLTRLWGAIDKMIIDGVQNPHEYYHAHGQWLDTDKAFANIFETCIEAGYPACALAGGNATASSLESAVWDLLDAVREHPIHCAINVPSACAAERMANYWLHGDLPAPGTVCSSDAPPYTDITWLDVFEKMSSSSPSVNGRRDILLHNREAYDLREVEKVLGRRWF